VDATRARERTRACASFASRTRVVSPLFIRPLAHGGWMPGWRFRPDADDVRSLLRLTTTRQPAGLWRHRSRVSRIRSGTYGARSVHTHAPREPVAGGVATRPRRERRRPPHPSPDAAGLSVPAFHDVRVRGYRYSEVRLCYLEMGVTVHVQVVAVVAGGGRRGWEPRPVILRYMRGPSAHLVCSFDLKLPCKLTYLLHHIF
jgi:hypothetical protein